MGMLDCPCGQLRILSILPRLPIGGKCFKLCLVLIFAIVPIRAVIEKAVADIRKCRNDVPDEPHCLHALCLQSLHHAMMGSEDLFRNV
eukprot:1940388-Amphidinium_carterae.2